MEEIPDLTPRQSTLLRYIVREHVRTVNPVASGTVVERYRLDISPATVRNEMARLEELGYLWQPHTSAGRVPTEHGYRYFVERLMEEQTLSLVEQRTIAHQFYQARDHIEEWVPLAASVLARTTRSAALVTAPKAAHAIYKHLELISTHGRAVLLVLVLEGGTVEQRFLALPEPLNQPTLSEAADRLNQRFSGLKSHEIREHINELPPLEADVAQLVLSLMEQAESLPADEIYYQGLPLLLQEPEFAEGEQGSTGLVRVLEEHSQLQAFIADALSPVESIGNVRVIIGGEGRWEALHACSLILTRYGVADYATGALGILGPIRMSYGRAISAVRFVSGVLNEMTYEMYHPTGRDLPSPDDRT
ncbi:MAG: heat-inducible transcriptional repressor HrcA, partial [Anaerolineae bacterium]